MFDVVYRCSEKGIIGETEVKSFDSLIQAVSLVDKLLKKESSTFKVKYSYIVQTTGSMNRIIPNGKILQVIQLINSFESIGNLEAVLD